MNTRLQPRLVIGRGLLLTAPAGGAARDAAGAPPPNLLVILLDDAGNHDFGFMGSRDLATPRLDRLSALGAVFTDAHVTASTCSPSRAGLMTGRYQQRFGHENNTPPDHQGMAVSERTLGDHLRAAGYRTHAIGKWHLGNRSPFHPNTRGFDEFFGLLEGSRSYFLDAAVDEPFNPRALQHNRRQLPFTGYRTNVLTDRALETVAAGSFPPWFIYLAYTAPHTPLQGWKGNKFEGGHRVPLVIAWPGVLPAGQRFDGLTSWERDLVPPAWEEPDAWNRVTFDIHRALMDNTKPLA